MKTRRDTPNCSSPDAYEVPVDRITDTSTTRRTVLPVDNRQIRDAVA